MKLLQTLRLKNSRNVPLSTSGGEKSRHSMAQLGPHLSLLRAKSRLCQGFFLSEGSGEEPALKHMQVISRIQFLAVVRFRVSFPCWLSAGGQSLLLEAVPSLFHASYVANLQQWQVMSSQSSDLFSFPICSMGQVDFSASLDCLCDYFAQTLRAQVNFSTSGQ